MCNLRSGELMRCFFPLQLLLLDDRFHEHPERPAGGAEIYDIRNRQAHHAQRPCPNTINSSHGYKPVRHTPDHENAVDDHEIPQQSTFHDNRRQLPVCLKTKPYCFVTNQIEDDNVGGEIDRVRYDGLPVSIKHELEPRVTLPSHIFPGLETNPGDPPALLPDGCLH